MDTLQAQQQEKMLTGRGGGVDWVATLLAGREGGVDWPRSIANRTGGVDWRDAVHFAGCGAVRSAP